MREGEIILLSSTCEHIVRMKKPESNEGGVCFGMGYIGYAVLFSD